MSDSITTNSVTVHGLVCHRDVNLALTCLGSLLKFSVKPIDLVIHDDGSLTSEDMEKLQLGLNQPTIIERRVADEKMNDLLAGYPHCQAYRREHVYGLKLLDIALMSSTDFAFCDSDILFFQPFQDLFQFPDDQTSAIFMQDYMDAYAMLPWHLWNANRLKLPSKVNTGVIFFRRSAYDLEFVNWFLGCEQFRHKVKWLEQSCWAALGHRVGCRQWNPQQVVLMRLNSQVQSGWVAGHFVGEVRHRLDEFVGVEMGQSVQQVTTFVPPDCNLLALGGVHGMRQVKRLRNYHKLPQVLRRKLLGV